MKMKVQLVANLATNGQLILTEQSAAYEAPAEISKMGTIKAMECGNVIMGAITYKMFAPVMKEIFSKLEVVVLTSKDVGESAYSAKTPEEAVSYLESKNFETVCVLGRAKTYNSFMAAGLADELFFNLFPVVIGGGGNLETVPGKVLDYKLSEARANGDVAMLHFVKV